MAGTTSRMASSILLFALCQKALHREALRVDARAVDVSDAARPGHRRRCGAVVLVIDEEAHRHHGVAALVLRRARHAEVGEHRFPILTRRRVDHLDVRLKRVAVHVEELPAVAVVRIPRPTLDDPHGTLHPVGAGRGPRRTLPSFYLVAPAHTLVVGPGDPLVAVAPSVARMQRL